MFRNWQDSLRRPGLRYGLAVALVAASFLLRLALTACVGPGLPTYITFYPAVMVAALLGGLGPGLLATGLAALAAAHWIVFPSWDLPANNLRDSVGLGLFSVLGAGMSVVAELYRRARVKAAAFEHEHALRETQEALLRATQDWERTFDSVPDLIAILDDQHRIVRANRAMAERLKLSPQQCAGQFCYHHVHGANCPPAACPHVLTLADGREHVAEIHEPRLGGDFLVSTTPLLDPQNRRIGSVHVARDVTERKRREDDLRRLNRTLRALSNGNQAWLRARDEAAFIQEVCQIVVHDCGHAMVWIGFAEADAGQTVRPVANAGFEEGYLETLGITWADTEHGRGPTGTAIRTGQPAKCTNMLTDPHFAPWRDQALKRGYASSIALPLLAEGKAFGALTIYSRDPDPFSLDETKLLGELADDLARGIRSFRLRAAQQQAEVALRQTAQELERSNRDLEQFAYVASHDLQEPLRAVSGYVELLRQRFPDLVDDKARGYIAGAVDGAARMQQLINDLLAFSRVSSRIGARTEVNLDELLESALANLQVSIRETGAKITHEPLPRLLADGAQVLQLFQNLVGNAIKFRGQQPPEVHLSAHQEKDAWLFAVKDNGIGIEPQYFERIFHIFQRLHTRSLYPGTGIGLAICKKIVEHHGGRIWVESQPGRGSTFYFTLPGSRV